MTLGVLDKRAARMLREHYRAGYPNAEQRQYQPPRSVTRHAYRPRVFAKFGADWTDAQTTRQLTTCGPEGEAINNARTLTAYVQSDKTEFDPSKATVAGSATTSIGAKVASGTVVEIVRDTSGDWVIPSTPHQHIVDWKVDTSNSKLQAQFGWSWGSFATTTTTWVDLHTGTECD
jgi:hypothetical protein